MKIFAYSLCIFLSTTACYAMKQKDSSELIANLTTQLDELLDQKRGITSLMRASSKGCEDMVKQLLELGAQVDAQDKCGRTALRFASEAGHKKIVQMLLDKGANVNSEDQYKSTVLIKAARKGHKEIIELLLAHDAFINSQDRYGHTALIEAIKKRHKEIVELLLKKGADPNLTYQLFSSKGFTALMAACMLRDSHIMKLLLEHKAEINAQAADGGTALTIAAGMGNREMVELLLNRGARLDVTFQIQYGATGITPLMTPCMLGHRQVVELLFEYKVNVNAQDSSGETALMRAVGHPHMVSLLLKKGADVTLINAAGEDALMHAVQKKAPYESIELLKAYQAPEIRECCSSPVEFVRKRKGHYKREYDDVKRHRSYSHKTLLMWASIFGHTQALDELLTEDIPLWYLNAQDNDGRTALMYALIYGNDECARHIAHAYENIAPQKLEKFRRAINISDNKGNSALIYALTARDSTIVLKLIMAGARPTVKGIQSLAQEGKQEALLQLILKGFIRPLSEERVHRHDLPALQVQPELTQDEMKVKEEISKVILNREIDAQTREIDMVGAKEKIQNTTGSFTHTPEKEILPKKAGTKEKGQDTTESFTSTSSAEKEAVPAKDVKASWAGVGALTGLTVGIYGGCWYLLEHYYPKVKEFRQKTWNKTKESVNKVVHLLKNNRKAQIVAGGTAALTAVALYKLGYLSSKGEDKAR